MASLVSFYEDEPLVSPDSEKRLIIDQRPIRDAGDFELGYPEPGVAYVRHPQSARRLLPLMSYHSHILVEKTNEAIAILTSLGASQIDLYHSTKISSQARADIELIFGMFGLGGEKTTREDTRVIYHAKGLGAKPRALPPLLWLDEPGWRGIVDGRLYSNLTEFSLSFTYEHRGGVTAELAAQVKRFGLRAGGEFHRSHNVAFNLEGTFPRLAASKPARQVGRAVDSPD